MRITQNTDAMKIIGKLRIILLMAAILFAGMVYKTMQSGAWRGKADEAGKMVEAGECFIDLQGLRESKEPVLLLKVGETTSDSLLHLLHLPEKQLTISDLADRVILKELKASGSRLVIVAAARSEGMKAWIMLHQLGVKDFYILSSGEGYDEALKNRFRPEEEFKPEPENRES